MTTPLRALLYTDKRAHRASKVPGSIWISEAEPGTEAMMWIVCPCGCGNLRKISIGHGFKPSSYGPTWKWNGSSSEPTLSPSVNCNPAGTCPGWHGWLRDGYWEVC